MQSRPLSTIEEFARRKAVHAHRSSRPRSTQLPRARSLVHQQLGRESGTKTKTKTTTHRAGDRHSTFMYRQMLETLQYELRVRASCFLGPVDSEDRWYGRGIGHVCPFSRGRPHVEDCTVCHVMSSTHLLDKWDGIRIYGVQRPRTSTARPRGSSRKTIRVPSDNYLNDSIILQYVCMFQKTTWLLTS